MVEIYSLLFESSPHPEILSWSDHFGAAESGHIEQEIQVQVWEYLVKGTKFILEVKNFWKSIPVAHLIPKLAEVSTFMARWGRTFFHKFKEKIKVQKSILDTLANETDEVSVQAYISAKEDLNNLFYHEETY